MTISNIGAKDFGRRRAFSTLVLLSLATLPLSAQSVSFGVKAGIQTTDPLRTSLPYDQSSHPLIIGPVVELEFPRALALEVNVLRTRQAYHHTEFVTFPVAEERQKETNADSWEIPFVLKKYVDLAPFIRVFANAGLNLRHTSGNTQVIGYELVRNLGPPGPPTYRRTTFFSGREEAPGELDRPWNAGLVLGGGQEFRIGFLRLQPQLRYTHWSNHTFRNFRDYLLSNRNSLDFLFGITFRKTESPRR